MSKLTYKPYYRRNLPHYQPTGATLFVTTRLAGSLPAALLAQWHADQQEQEAALLLISDETARRAARYDNLKRAFGLMDRALDAPGAGPTWLAEAPVARIVYDSIHYLNGRLYDLDACTIMPNHIHLLFRPLPAPGGSPHALSAITASLKKWTAREANLLLGREGAFWQHESYDHVVRDADEWQRVLRYILENPVRAGLAETWPAWPWTWLREDEPQAGTAQNDATIGATNP